MKLGWPTGFAPAPRHSQCRMLTLTLRPTSEILSFGSSGGPRSRTDRVKACYAAYLHYGGITGLSKWYPRLASHQVFHLRRVVCLSYTTGTFQNWRPMPVMLRRDLIDNQAGCYYLNGANAVKWWLVSVSRRPLAAFNDALICLSYPTAWKCLSRLVTLQRLPLIRRALYS